MEGKTAEDSGEISCDEESYANRLKFVQLKPDCLDGHSVNEWTVIYSDSNSSIMSDLNDEDNDDNVDGVRTDNNNLIDDEKIEVPDVDKSLPTDCVDAKTEDNPDLIDSANSVENDLLINSANIDEFVMSATEQLSASDVADGKQNDSSTTILSEKFFDEQPVQNSLSLCESSTCPTFHIMNLDPVGPNYEFESIIDSKMEPPPPPPSFADNDLGSESSDIAIISEDDDVEDSTIFNDQESLLSLVSVVSQNSNFSMLREKYLQSQRPSYLKRRLSFLNKDIPPDSVPSDDDTSSQTDLCSYHLDKHNRIRAYFHTPNTVLNGKLNLILILSITAVIGLGIGHFIGWSNVYNRHQQLSLGQVMKLKQLQDDLLVCMKDQASSTVSELGNESRENKVCLHDSDYWKERFKALFNENKSLIGLFQRTQKHFHENGNRNNVIDEKECVNKTTSDEFHNLKLDLLVKQMEHLKLLEVLEEVKTIGKQNQKRVRVLEEENQDLKKKLVEEEEDDQEIVETWGQRVAVLQNENDELRKTIEVDDVEDMKVIDELKAKINLLSEENRELKSIFEQLEKQIFGDGESKNEHKNNYLDNNEQFYESFNKDNSNLSTYYNSIRERINQLMSENEDLKSNIALYRYSAIYNNLPTADNVDDVFEAKSANKPSDDNNRKFVYSERIIETLKTKLSILHRQLLIEQGETARWKNRFDNLVRKQKKTDVRLNRKMRNKKFDNNIVAAEDDDEDDDDNVVYNEDIYFKSENVEKKRKHSKQADKKKASKKKKEKPDSKINDNDLNDDNEYDNESIFDNWKDSIKDSLKTSKKYWKSFMNKMKDNINESKKKFKKNWNSKQIVDAGKMFVTKFKDNIVENNKNLVNYISNQVSNLGQLLEKNFNVNLEEINKHFPFSQNGDTVRKDDMKNSDHQSQKVVNEENDNKEMFDYYSESADDEDFFLSSSEEWNSMKGEQKGKLEEQNLSDEDESNDWTLLRAQAREKARNKLFDETDQKIIEDWLLERAKAREKYRNKEDTVF